MLVWITASYQDIREIVKEKNKLVQGVQSEKDSEGARLRGAKGIIIEVQRVLTGDEKKEGGRGKIVSSVLRLEVVKSEGHIEMAVIFFHTSESRVIKAP